VLGKAGHRVIAENALSSNLFGGSWGGRCDWVGRDMKGTSPKSPTKQRRAARGKLSPPVNTGENF